MKRKWKKKKNNNNKTTMSRRRRRKRRRKYIPLVVQRASIRQVDISAPL